MDISLADSLIGISVQLTLSLKRLSIEPPPLVLFSGGTILTLSELLQGPPGGISLCVIFLLSTCPS